MNHPLFKDIDDLNLRSYNRAMIMLNIFEDNMVDVYDKAGERLTQITGVGVRELKGYFAEIPEDERVHVYEIFKDKLREKGYKHVQ